MELFSKCKELLVTICCCHLSYCALSQEEEEMLALSPHMLCVTEGCLIVIECVFSFSSGSPNQIIVIFRQSVSYNEGWLRIGYLTLFN